MLKRVPLGHDTCSRISGSNFYPVYLESLVNTVLHSFCGHAVGLIINYVGGLLHGLPFVDKAEEQRRQ